MKTTKRSQSTLPSMKEDHYPPPPPPPRRRTLLTKATAFLLLFSLGYTLGFLSSSSSSSSTTTHHLQTQQTTATILPQSQQTTTPTVAEPPPPDLLRFRTRCADPVPQSEILPTLLNRVYNDTSPYDDFPHPHTASLLLSSRRPRGWGSTSPVFRHLIETVRPRTIIELGTFLGASALHMASLTSNLSIPSIILCIDDFRGWPGFRRHLSRDVPPELNGDSLLLHQFMLGVVRAGETGRVLPLPFSTGSALASLCEWGVYGDLIEVDAGHDFHSAWSDINMAYAVLRPGGVLFGHDYHTAADDHGVRRAVTLFAKVNGLRVQPHGQHWVLLPAKRQTGS